MNTYTVNCEDNELLRGLIFIRTKESGGLYWGTIIGKEDRQYWFKPEELVRIK